MKVEQGKNRVCSHNHAFGLDNIIRKLFQSPKRIVGSYIKSGDIILDLGCGPGFFTIEMAKMTGRKGRVVAVDVQSEMLDKLADKIWDTELAKRIDLHKGETDSTNLPQNLEADFVLAFYMVHEIANPGRFFKEIRQNVKKGGNMLVVEPPFHVSRSSFETYINLAEEAGWNVSAKPKGKGGYGLLLTCQG